MALCHFYGDRGWLCVTFTDRLVWVRFRGASPPQGEQRWAVINNSSIKGAFEAHTCLSGVSRVGRGSGPSAGLGYHRLPARAWLLEAQNLQKYYKCW